MDDVPVEQEVPQQVVENAPEVQQPQPVQMKARQVISAKAAYNEVRAAAKYAADKYVELAKAREARIQAEVEGGVSRKIQFVGHAVKRALLLEPAKPGTRFTTALGKPANAGAKTDGRFKFTINPALTHYGNSPMASKPSGKSLFEFQPTKALSVHNWNVKLKGKSGKPFGGLKLNPVFGGGRK